MPLSSNHHLQCNDDHFSVLLSNIVLPLFFASLGNILWLTVSYIYIAVLWFISFGNSAFHSILYLQSSSIFECSCYSPNVFIAFSVNFYE